MGLTVNRLAGVLERLVRRDASLLVRIRWLFALLNLLLVGLMLSQLAVLPYPFAPAWPAKGILAALIVLLGVWAIMFARLGGPRGWLDVVPIPLLLAMGLVGGAADWTSSGQQAVLLLHALYRPSTKRTVTLVIAYAGIAALAFALVGNPTPGFSVVQPMLLAAMIAPIAQAIAAAVIRHEELRRRDAVLTDVTTALLIERDQSRIDELVAAGAYELVDAPGVTVMLWRGGSERLTLKATAGADVPGINEAMLAMLPESLQTAYRDGRALLVPRHDLSRAQATFGLPARFTAAVGAPIMRGGVPSGALAIMSPTSLDRDLVPVVQRFVNEVALAHELAEQEVVLAEREALLSGIVENSSDLITVIDESDILTYVSPVVGSWTGHLPEEFVGKPLSVLLSDGEHETVGNWRALGRTGILRIAGREGERDVEVTANELGAGAQVLNIRDVTERRRLEAEVTYRAFYDPVTGLANRSRFMDRLEQAIRRSHRDGSCLAVVMIDLDDFKAVNDTLGHAAGDALLLHVGDRLAGVVRETDTAARLGGDEFAVLLTDVADAAEATKAAARLLNTLRAPVWLEGHEVSVAASAGVAVSAQAVHPDELLRDADAAMYDAKGAGKNQYALFAPHMHERSLSRTRMRVRLEAALDREEFVLHYQPLMRLDTQEVAGFEASVRWRDPERGLVAPAEFVPLAEEAGLIVPIGEWVLEEACRQLAAWDAMPEVRPDLGMSVNVSESELRGDIVGRVATALETSAIASSRLTLAVTERAFIGDADEIAASLKALRTLGVRIAIDDFGTGYSSFSHLQRFPVDAIKVGREFVSLVTDGPEHAALAEAIVKLARKLGIQSVAKGVETPRQAAVLRDWGCDQAQGWLWSPSVPAAEAIGAVAPAAYGALDDRDFGDDARLLRSPRPRSTE